MDLNQIVFGDGLVLTSDGLEDRINPIVSHQITRQDWADGFVWGMEIDVDGEGIIAASHINGRIADASQLAIDWIEATTDGQGIVYVPALASPWTIDAQITVPTGFWVLGGEGCKLNVTGSLGVFFVVDNVRISRFMVDGNNNDVTFVFNNTLGGIMRNIIVEDCRLGDPTDAANSVCRGFLFDMAGGAGECQIRNNVLIGGGGLYKTVSLFNGYGNQIYGNRMLDPQSGGYSTVNDVIWTRDDVGLIVRDNHGVFWDAATSGPNNVIRLVTGCTGAKIYDNDFEGGQDTTMVATASTDLQIHDNRFVNGNTSGGGAILDLKAGCDRANVHGNFVTCDAALSSPKNADYSLRIEDTGGADHPEDCVIHDNLFERLEDVATVPGTNPYFALLAGLRDQGTNTHRWGNTFIQGQRIIATTSGTPAATEVVTCPGNVDNAGTHADREFLIQSFHVGPRTVTDRGFTVTRRNVTSTNEIRIAMADNANTPGSATDIFITGDG
jgi:hypothetical protein